MCLNVCVCVCLLPHSHNLFCICRRASLSQDANESRVHSPGGQRPAPEVAFKVSTRASVVVPTRLERLRREAKVAERLAALSSHPPIQSPQSMLQLGQREKQNQSTEKSRGYSADNGNAIQTHVIRIDDVKSDIEMQPVPPTSPAIQSRVSNASSHQLSPSTSVRLAHPSPMQRMSSLNAILGNERGYSKHDVSSEDEEDEKDAENGNENGAEDPDNDNEGNTS